MTTFAHLSDLHFGTVDPAIARALLDDLTRATPAAIAISGDLTQRARTSEFLAARQFLDALPAPHLVVPGNHDVAPLYRPWSRLCGPLGRYRQHIHDDLEPVLCVGRVALLGVNTARASTLSDGRVSREQMKTLRARMGALPDGMVKTLVAHHPFLVPTWGKGHHDLVGRGHETLQALDDVGIDLLLAGHLHVAVAGGTHAFPALQRHALVVQAGTALSRRTRGERNSYNMIELEGESVRVEVRVWDGARFAQGTLDLYERDGDGLWRRTGGVAAA
jgi:3',5'-cyclic AMP phosphodiesterase CpdA